MLMGSLLVRRHGWLRLAFRSAIVFLTKLSNIDLQQTCKACGHQEKFDFHIDEKTWTAVVPPRFRNRVLCLACFDAFAAAKNIDYSGSLELLCFAGDKASFRFSVDRGINVSTTGNH